MCALNLFKRRCNLLKELGIYIHIPFCSSKCYYCDFVSFSGLDKRVDEYIYYLLLEMDIYKELLKEYTVKTIFIGGGTPSYINESYIERILKHIYENFNVEGVQEITIEANPGTLNREKLILYKEMGINRISMGVQTLNEKLLKDIGRRHTVLDFYKNYEMMRKIGFENINVDLMFGLPNQTLDDCMETINKVIDLDVEHISYYSLIIEEKTLMNKWFKEGKILLPEEEEEREMYHMGKQLLESKGYKHYEISNFAKLGFECKHNLIYWQIKPYIGFGIASHSNIKNTRFWNYDNFKDYINALKVGKAPISGNEYIDRRMEIAEYLIMGLRLIDGVNKDDFRNRFNQDVEEIYSDVLSKYVKENLLVVDSDNIRFTERGLDLSNIVYVDLLP